MEKQNEKQTVFPEKNSFTPLDFFVFRSPTLPIQYYYSLAERMKKSDLKLGDLISSNKRIERALAVGNPSFYGSLKNAKEDAKSSKDYEKLLGKLLRVLIRMSTRSTPFGLYSGVAIGRWGERSELKVADSGNKTRSRLDMELVAKLAFGLEKELLNRLDLVLNPTVRLYGNRLYLLEKAPVLDEKDVDGSWIESTAEVDLIVKLTKTPISYGEVLKALVDTGEIDEEDSHLLIDYLVENTYLLTNLRPNTFDARAGEDLLEVLNASEKTELREAMAEAIDTLHSFNNGKIEITEQTYTELNKKVGDMLKEGKISNSGLQTDMELELSHNSLNKNLANELARYADLLIRLSPQNPQDSALNSYRERFMRRFEGREVPILELLNQDYGLGFPDYLAGPAAGKTDHGKQRIIDEFVAEAIRDQKLEVVVDATALTKLMSPVKDFVYPTSCDLFVDIIANSLEDMDNGNYQFVNGSVVNGAGRNLGRFADMLGDKAIGSLKDVIAAEEKIIPEYMNVELSSMARMLRLGNVSTVPLVRPYHIVIDSWPGTENEIHSEIIPLDDLLVGIKDDRFYLRSKKHGTRVLVNSPSLANPTYKTQIARFLTAVCEDATLRFGGRFSWGTASAATFTPRLRFEKFILSPARWTIHVDADLKTKFNKADAFKSWISQWRQRWFVPRFVQLRDFDNLLLLDLDDEAQLEELRREYCTTKQSSLNLQESFCDPQQLWVEGPEGKYASELVASFILSEKPEEKQSESFPLFTADVEPEDRVRIPGKDWIYFKLYAGKSLQEDILVQSVQSLVDELKNDKLIDSWFFIRYADPEQHLRIRFNGNADLLRVQVLPRVMELCDQLFTEQLCQKFVIDSYDREIERYGGNEAIGVAERLFSADSELVQSLLRLESCENWSFVRNNVCSMTVDLLMESLGFVGEEKSAWYKKFAPARTEMGTEYRNQKDALHQLFVIAYDTTTGASPRRSDGANSEDDESVDVIAELIEVLRIWKERLQKVGEEYRSLEKQGLLTFSFAHICSSFVHMHCNRYLGVELLDERKVRALAARSHESRVNRKEGKSEKLVESAV